MSKLTKTKSSFDGVDEAAMEVGQWYNLFQVLDRKMQTTSISDVT